MVDVTISPPPRLLELRKESAQEALTDYVKKDLITFASNLYQYNYFMWERTGGYKSTIPISYIVTDKKSNFSSGSENELMNYKLPNDSITNILEIIAFGTFASNANNKQIKVYFGSLLIFDTGSLAINGGSWEFNSNIVKIKETNVSQKISSTMITSNSLLVAKSNYVLSSQDLSDDVILKFTAIGGAANDVVQECLVVQFS